MQESDTRGRAIYSDYIKEQLDAQEARKISLEQRGLAVITTSGVLVTLLFGLTALRSGGRAHSSSRTRPPPSSRR